ncbi:MAG TPA: c-type cytochrome [Acidimicrobiia bacterium]|nr:c-type cytochrome [Acidimicrobiia bacterium]
MTADVITVLAVVAGIAWLGVVLVSALRNRGGAEEVSPNLKPGMDDQHLETRRLEGGQKAAIAFSAFLAVSLPLYFLGESDRQEGFVEEFSEASIERGDELVSEFGCFDCHGPLGAGGSAPFVEPRSGISVSWTAPSLDDIFYRYDEDEVTYWVTYGRGNTPMPAWGVAGGGPMNERQVQDVVAYLHTIQKPQQDLVNETVSAVDTALSDLASADAAMEAVVLSQRQVIAEIDQAEADLEVIKPLSERAVEVLAGAREGIDTDADGLADAAEQELSEISSEAVAHFQPFPPPVLDPATPDIEILDEALAALTEAAQRDPILETYVASITAVIDADEITEESPDGDDDGISDAAEAAITGLFSEAVSEVVPATVTEIDLDPTNPESVSGVPDRTTAANMVGGLDTVAINVEVAVENVGRILPQQNAGLDFLLGAQESREWAIDFEGVAEAMGGTVEEAQRAVGLFNGFCARCHTASFNAGLPFSQQIGSGGFGPALFEGRPVVQFGEAPATDSNEVDLLLDFLINGSEQAVPYGLNGFGSGEMPGWGATLDLDDIVLLTRFLRGGNLNGMED